MSYITRTMEPLVSSVASEYSAVLVTGPRQVGKSTMLGPIIESKGLPIETVTLDDMTERQLAATDPAMFLQIHKPPVLIDEVQYAPELFSQIKMLVDQGAPPGSFWLTGSQQFRLMELAGETLAGRVAVLPLSSLTQVEALGMPGAPFGFSVDFWKEREKSVIPADVTTLFDRMHRGAMPAVVSGKYTNLTVFYNSYIQTYIERDVRRLLGNVDVLEFIDFMRAATARTAQLVNVASMAKDVGIRQEKAKAWLSVLEKSGIAFFLHPYANNQLKRTVKAPKLYFHDCGLVAHLTKWTSAETMQSGAMAGAFMENFVVSEIYKSYLNVGAEPALYYYRDHDAKEIDLIIESNGELHPIEVKKTASPNASMTKNFSVLDKGVVPRGCGAIVCAAEHFSALDGNTLVIPAGLL